MRIHAQRRSAFTLIELLVVIAIIAILASLTAAAAMKVLYRPQEVRARTEISQLEGAIEQFKTKYGVEYIPSQLYLCQHYSEYTQLGVPGLQRDSVDYITKTIGRNSPAFKTRWMSANGIKWNLNNNSKPQTLEGHQCLVFFLGGIQTTNGAVHNCVGFSTDPTNPDAAPTPGVDRVGPFFSFQSPRLSPPSASSFPSGNANTTYFAYGDSYGSHKNGAICYYVYFSSYKHANGYNPYPTGDCGNLISPYIKSTTPTKQFVNPDSYQIICAGLDGVFGPGGLATPGQLPLAAQDDQANFASGKLGFGY